jgi:hypothetical protein
MKTGIENGSQTPENRENGEYPNAQRPISKEQ